MFQITLIAHEHDDDVRICVVPKLFQPPGDIHIGCVLSDVVNQESTDRTAVVTIGRLDERIGCSKDEAYADVIAR
jgi:hypothetical protein